MYSIDDVCIGDNEGFPNKKEKEPNAWPAPFFLLSIERPEGTNQQINDKIIYITLQDFFKRIIRQADISRGNI